MIPLMFASLTGRLGLPVGIEISMISSYAWPVARSTALRSDRTVSSLARWVL